MNTLRLATDVLPDRDIADIGQPWFALRVRSNFERVSAHHLRHRGYEEFLPTYRVKRQWSDRMKDSERLLFPGYLFCRVNPVVQFPVLSTPGIIGLVGIGKKPIAIPDHEILRVRALIESAWPITPWPFLQTGEWVLIERGPLAGIEGILTEFKKGFRIVVSISLLQRSVAAEVDADCVRPLRMHHPS